MSQLLPELRKGISNVDFNPLISPDYGTSYVLKKEIGKQARRDAIDKEMTWVQTVGITLQRLLERWNEWALFKNHRLVQLFKKLFDFNVSRFRLQH